MSDAITPHLMTTYNRIPVAFTHGQGCWIWDDQGNKYLDGLSGIAVNTLGHAHPKLVSAIAEQAGRLLHTSNLYRIPSQERAADRLCEVSGMDNVFFCNSGCEATEAAIKLARLYGHNRGVSEPHIIVMEKAFHGRTIATLSATGSSKVQAGFEPLVPGFVRVPHDDLAAIERVAQQDKQVVAVLVEPIQGEGGINVARVQYLQGLRQLCDRMGWLLMLDEVQCGIGRTGRWFTYQHADVLPDVLPLAKGLAGGLAIGACAARGVAAQTFKPGNHGSTFGGNPMACTGAVVTLDAIEQEGLLDNAARCGQLIMQGLHDGLAGIAGVRAIRGMGLMIGVELDRPCGELVQQAMQAGLLINVTADSVVRLLPPLVIEPAQCQLLIDILVPLIRNFLNQH